MNTDPRWDRAAYALREASRVDWPQPAVDVPVDRYFGVVETPGPLCDDALTGCPHESCAILMWPVRWITGVPCV